MRDNYTFDEAVDEIANQDIFYYDMIENKFIKIENVDDLLYYCYDHDCYYSDIVDKGDVGC